MQSRDTIRSSCFHRELVEKLKKEARECGEEIVVQVKGEWLAEGHVFIIHVTWDTDADALLKTLRAKQDIWCQPAHKASHVGPCRSASSVFGYSV